VGSEKTEPGDGWPYDTILQYLTTTPTATPNQLATQIVQRYMASYPTNLPVTQSAVTASLLTDLHTATSNLAAAIAGDMDGTLRSNLATLRNGLYEYDGEPYVDLYQFAEAIKNSGTITTYDTLAQKVMDNITACVIANGYQTPELVNSHGLTVYFPKTASGFSSNYQNNPWSAAGSWDEFLISFYTGNPSAGNDDVYEVNNDFDNAAPLLPSVYPGLIWNDDDYYKLNVYANENITVSMTYTHAAGTADLDLYLYDGLRNPVDLSEYEDGFEEVYWEVPSNQIVYIFVDNFASGTAIQYDLMIEIEAVDDLYEENDVSGDAVLISGGLLNSTIENLKAFDTDWFYFNEPMKEDILCWILLGYKSSEGIISMNIYGWDDPYLDLLASVASPNDNEEFWFSPWQIEMQFGFDYTAYYIEIISYQRNANYSLTVGYDIYYDDIYDDDNDYLISAPTLTDGWHTDLICIDMDIYAISLVAGQWVYIELDFINAQGDLDLYLFDAFGDEQLAQSFYWNDGEFIKYRARSSGIHKILVFPYEINLNYSIFVNTSTSQSFAYDQFDSLSYDIYLGPDLQVNTLYQGLTAWQDDFFWAILTSGREVEITMAYTAAETTLALVVYDNSGYLVAFSYSAQAPERLVFTPSYSGYFIIHILVIKGVESYSLIISQDQSSSPSPPSDNDGNGIPGFATGAVLGCSLFAIAVLIVRRKRNSNL
jgi:hypothetical protein